MRSVEEIKHVIESLEADIERFRGYRLQKTNIKDGTIGDAICMCKARINALKWVILERTTWL